MSWMDQVDDVELSSRSRALPFGTHEVTLISAREHRGRQGGLGVLVDVEMGGKKYGWRIALGGKFPEYGVREVKALAAAVLGIQDPKKANAEITKGVIAALLSENSPMCGKAFGVEAYGQTNKDGTPQCDPRGVQYTKHVPYALSTAFAVPAIPSIEPFPPPGWQKHPGSTEGKVFYFRDNQVLSESDLRALTVTKAA